MKVIRTIQDLVTYVDDCKVKGLSIGLVPTMGALHEGHLSLVSEAVSGNDRVVISDFVNPTQFNNPVDLETYPRNEERDFSLLEEAKVDVVFAPSVNEIYPDGLEDVGNEKKFDLGYVADVMEGKFRPGHFQGVAQIVNKLFLLVRPDRAYFGEKDFQQIAVIRRMTETENISVEIVACPIKRAADGLALSSRNQLLTPEQRLLAPEIHRILLQSVEYAGSHSVKATIDMVIEYLDALPEMKVEYYVIVDGYTLKPIKEWSDSDYVVGSVTCYCGKVRLIDNITYKK